MKEIIEKLNNIYVELGINKIENVELLLNLSEEDISNQTDLSYQVTPIFEKILEFSKIYTYLNYEEESELLQMNQTDFFSKIHNAIRLSEELLNDFRNRGMLHPVLDADIEFEDVLCSQEDCISILDEIKEILEEADNEGQEEFEMGFSEFPKNPLISRITTYSDRVVGYCQMIFSRQVIPKLRDDMFEENYQDALQVLSNYIHLKLELLAGLNQDDSLFLVDISMDLHQLLNPEIVDDIYHRIELEKERFDSEDLEDEEYLNLLILMFENKYQRQKSCQYYYRDKMLEVEAYKEKCKKM